MKQRESMKLVSEIPSIKTQLDNIAKTSSDKLQEDILKYSTIYIDKDISINQQIDIPSNKKIKFRNGAKIKATISGGNNVFKLNGNNISLYYPKIEYEVTTPSPHAGYGNAICMGDYASPNEIKHCNIKIINPVITKNDNQHSVIGVFNGCKDIDIINPNITNGALGIIMHWGGDFDESQPHTSQATVSYHPHNIKIVNYDYNGTGKPIHFASCYNVELDGLNANNSSTCVEVGVGDYANAIATPRQKNLVCKQLKIKNVYGYNIKGNAISVAGKGRRGGQLPDYVIPSYDIEIENIVVEKGADTGNGSVCVVCNNKTSGVKIKNISTFGYEFSSQIFIQDSENIKINGCDYEENNHGITLHNSKDITISDSHIKTKANGINFSATSEDIKIIRCKFSGCQYPIFIKDGKNISIEDCYFTDFKSNCLKFDGDNSNINISNNKFNEGSIPNISSHIELGKLKVANVYGNVFNNSSVKFNINILTDAFSCVIHDNISHGSTNTNNPMMIYQGTRDDISNTVYNNNTLNGFNIGTFNKYYTFEKVTKS